MSKTKQFLASLFSAAKAKLRDSGFADELKDVGKALIGQAGDIATQAVKGKAQQYLGALASSGVSQGAPFMPSQPMLMDAHGTFPQGSYTGGDGRLLIGSDQPRDADSHPIVKVEYSSDPAGKQSRGLYPAQYPKEVAVHGKSSDYGSDQQIGNGSPGAGFGWGYGPANPAQAAGYGEEPGLMQQYISGDIHRRDINGKFAASHKDNADRYKDSVEHKPKYEESYEDKKKRQKEKYRLKRDRERIAAGKLPLRTTVKESGGHDDSKQRYYENWTPEDLTKEEKKKIKVPKQFAVAKAKQTKSVWKGVDHSGQKYDYKYKKGYKQLELSKEELVERRKILAAKKKRAAAKAAKKK